MKRAGSANGLLNSGIRPRPVAGPLRAQLFNHLRHWAYTAVHDYADEYAFLEATTEEASAFRSVTGFGLDPKIANGVAAKVAAWTWENIKPQGPRTYPSSGENPA